LKKLKKPALFRGFLHFPDMVEKIVKVFTFLASRSFIAFISPL